MNKMQLSSSLAAINGIPKSRTALYDGTLAAPKGTYQ